jgi:phosphatidylglycerol---prolipoprotein diacylglyceryl transferase
MLAIYFPKWLTPDIPGLPIPVHWYGLMYVVVAIIGYILLKMQVKEHKSITNDDVYYIFIWSIVGAILGARLAHVIFIQPELFLEPYRIILPIDIVNGKVIYTGIAGMSFYGGIFGVILALWLYTKYKKINFFLVSDMLAAAFPLGYTFGRLGNFFNQEFRGRPAPDWLPWKIYYWDPKNVNGNLVFGRYEDVARHPSQIYEALLQGVILWLVLWFIIKPRKLWYGFLMGSYISGYGIARFITEFFRVRNDPLEGVFFLTTSQLICIGLIIIGLLFIYFTKKISERSLSKKEKKAKKS